MISLTTLVLRHRNGGPLTTSLAQREAGMDLLRKKIEEINTLIKRDHPIPVEVYDDQRELRTILHKLEYQEHELTDN